MAMPPTRRRLVICCDGTWQDSEGDVAVPSNVTRIARAVNPIWWDESTNPPTPISQIVYYHNGVGTGSLSLWTKYVGGATGEGISINIRSAYTFICQNYHQGDEIFLIGFSRGAFTARSISSLIRSIGLLTASGLEYLTPIFNDWKSRGKYKWTTPYPDASWSDECKVGTVEYQKQLSHLELTLPSVPIKCVAVWDTVGALGIPAIWLLPQNAPSDYQLVNTLVEDNIEYAYQALALDERRRPYTPTIWEKPDTQPLPRVLKQTWFPGVHSDVGGSYDDADLANITLTWMVSQLDHLISFDHGVINRTIRKSKEKHELRKESLRPWGLGRIHDSMNIFFMLFGTKIRTPKEYYQIDMDTRRPSTRRLANTCEVVHSSARVRMGKNGLGYADRGAYDTEKGALAGWTLYGQETALGTPDQQSLPGVAGKMKNVVWKKTVVSKDEKGNDIEETLVMSEDELTGYEREILKLWPEMLNDDVDCIRPDKHPMSIKHAHTFDHNDGPSNSGSRQQPGSASPELAPKLGSPAPRTRRNPFDTIAEFSMSRRVETY